MIVEVRGFLVQKCENEDAGIWGNIRVY